MNITTNEENRTKENRTKSTRTVTKQKRENRGEKKMTEPNKQNVCTYVNIYKNTGLLSSDSHTFTEKLHAG